MESEDSDPDFGSQDDALLHQACEAFESDIAAVPMEVQTDIRLPFESDSQDRALYDASDLSEEYEHSISDSEAAAAVSSDRPCGGGSPDPAGSAAASGMSNPAPARSGPELWRELGLLRLGNTYLTVSNLVSQLWCEQQMVYNFWKPDLQAVIASTPSIAPAVVAAVTAVGTAAKGGKKLHKKRDHEVNKYVPVVTKTREDEYGVRLFNTIHSLRNLLLHGKPRAREVAIFGTPLGGAVPVVGTVDELRFDDQARLELVEFKTRADPARPVGAAQMQGYRMQTMLYKRMLDDLATGRVDGLEVLRLLNLCPGRVLGEELAAAVRELGIGPDGAVELTLELLMESALQHFQFLQSVQVLTLEFGARDGGRSLVKETVAFDADWLQQRLQHCLAYWSGEREPCGVDIEDTWKCRSCAFIERCEWRSRMADICVQKNQSRKNQPLK